MTNSDREHSRVGPAGGLGARGGAGQLRTDGDVEMSGEQTAAEGAAAEAGPGGAGGTERQPFVGEGHLTGRPMPPQDPGSTGGAMAGEPAAGDDAAAGDTVAGDLAQLLTDNAELTNHLQRMAADFDNYRKRARREVEQASASAGDRLLGELLAVLDDLERALEHAGDETSTQLGEGIRMVHTRLSGVLAAHGLEEVAVDGAFDPHLHDAMMMQPTPDVEDGQVVQVLQKGYRIGDRVLRHAKVIVSGG